MKPTQKIAVIGGTGKSGKYLVEQLLNQGFSCKILVRNPDRLRIQHPLLGIIIGDVKDYRAVCSLVEGCDAVISTLGLGIPPDEPTLFSLATRHILRAMHACGVDRYIVTTGLHVDTPLDKKGAKSKAATDWMYANYPVSTADRQTEYSILAASNSNWTLVRLPLIKQTHETYGISVSLQDCPGDKISAADLAHFLTGQIADNTFSKQAPFIANV
jgi:putative NADH-flavin reductase